MLALICCQFIIDRTFCRNKFIGEDFDKDSKSDKENDGFNCILVNETSAVCEQV